MATDLNATSRAAEMTSINTVAGATAYLFIYSGTQPTKTTSPTGTSAITGGIALSNPAFTQGTDGTDANTKLTLASVPKTGTATASITPGWYRITSSATDDGTHTVVQGSAGVGSGDLNFASTISSGGTVSITAYTLTEGNV
ncbi:MAG: hypothetical protein ACLP9L_15735 [Thermoguttaceae bacterium]